MPAEIHLHRALGGPMFTLISGVVALILYPAKRLPASEHFTVSEFLRCQQTACDMSFRSTGESEKMTPLLHIYRGNKMSLRCDPPPTKNLCLAKQLLSSKGVISIRDASPSRTRSDDGPSISENIHPCKARGERDGEGSCLRRSFDYPNLPMNINLHP